MKNITLKNILTVVKYLLIYYLSAKMICFAIPKLLHMQFRILHYESYLPLVEISKYQHMWSFFGRSYNYNIFIGMAEFLIGALVVFKRTRLLALLISLGVCANITILNIEFDIDFALAHVLVDFAITLVLLAGYHKDLYRFFIEMGGKFNREAPIEKFRSYKVYLPFLFVLILSVSYSIFAYTLRSTVNDEVVGTYEIKSILLNKEAMEISRGTLGNRPMMFLEHNNQAVLSINDSLYFGSYYAAEDSLRIGFMDPVIGGIKIANGSLDQNSMTGFTDEEVDFEIIYERIDGDKNYLNELYR